MNGNGNEQTAKKFKIFLAAFFYILSQIEKKARGREEAKNDLILLVVLFIFFFYPREPSLLYAHVHSFA